MISHRYKCIFIHIPKCAGTSIEHAFGHQEGHVGTGSQDHRPLRWIEPLQWRNIVKNRSNLRECWRRFRYRLKPAKNYRNKFRVTPEQFEGYYKFTIVRNPWSRAFSWYRGATRNKTARKMYGITGNPGFKEFLTEHAGTGYLRPQGYWLRSFDGSYPFDYIGRFESLERDFMTICKHMGVEGVSLPHKLKGSGEDYRRHYDNETRELVQRVYNEEIERFGYTFEQ